MKIPFRMVQLLVTAADISGLLFYLNTHGISVHYVRYVDDLSACFCIQQRQYHQALRQIAFIGGKVEKSTPAPAAVLVNGLFRRPMLICGITMLLALTLYLPTRILFVSVTGNDKIADREILEAAMSSGVYFGVSRSEIRSEVVKNRLLSELPELKWVGVNTLGCVAQISVRERTATNTSDDSIPPGNVIASYDGVIREVTVIKGTPVCYVGQAVTKGELLVTGYSDCGRCVYITGADAEVYAKTMRTIRVSSLDDSIGRTAPKGNKRKYGLLIGKKRINFYKESGIFDTTCVRMYEEYHLTLPGGFHLPIALTIQEETYYDVETSNVAHENMQNVLRQSALQYLVSQMNAGKVEQEDYRIVENNGLSTLIGQYTCDEMIGQTYSEEIIKNYEQTD